MGLPALLPMPGSIALKASIESDAANQTLGDCIRCQVPRLRFLNRDPTSLSSCRWIECPRFV
jgi:hypothetical protein